jgi:hypothetical protein
MRTVFGVLGLAMLMVIAGCGSSSNHKVRVSGNVKLKDGMLPDGHIVFLAADGATAPDAGPIKDGKYSFEALPGKKKVEITASREEGAVDPAMGVAPRKQYIAPQYNTETKLEAEVTASGPNVFDFTVTEK